MEPKCKLILWFLINLSMTSTEDKMNLEVSPKKDEIDSLLNKRGSTAKLIGNNSNVRRESKIAEIFMGVAYGAIKQEIEDKEIASEATEKLETSEITEDKDNNISGVNSFGSDGGNDDFKLNSKTLDETSLKNERRKTSTISSESYVGDSNVKSEWEMSSNYANETNLLLTENERRDAPLWIKISNQLGTVWFIHVYLFATLFCFVALLATTCLISLLCLQRDSSCWHSATLYVLIISMALTRSTLLITDPYGVYDNIPELVAAILHNIIVPSTVSVVAILLFVLINDACIQLLWLPKWMLLLVSASLTSGMLTIDLLKLLSKYPDFLTVLKAALLAFVACWGSVLCLGFVAVLIKIEQIYQDEKVETQRRVNYLQSANECKYQSIQIRRASRFGAVAGFIQLLLSGLIVYSLVGPKESPGASSLLTWAWWLQHSLARILEVSLYICVTISTTFISIQKQNCSSSPFFSPLFKMCHKSKAAGVHPNQSIGRQSVNIFTLPKPQDSVDYFTSDFQLVWTQGRNQQEQNCSHSNNDLTSGGWKLSSFKQGSKSDTNVLRRTLPPKPFVSFQTFSPEQVYDTIKDDYENVIPTKTTNKDILVPNYNYIKHSKLSSDNLGKAASVSTERSSCSNVSDATALYWSPTNSIGRIPVYFNPYSRVSNSLDQISEANTNSQSEVRIDYLTDISSSVDGISLRSEVTPKTGRAGFGRSGRCNPSLTLPFRTFSNISDNDNRREQQSLSRSETSTPLLEETSLHPS